MPISLLLEGPMKQPYLIQRCKIKGEFVKTDKVSDYLELDYMGSAEFEFGAIPASLRRFHAKLNKLHTILIPGGIFLLCKEDESRQYASFLQQLAQEKFRLKERVSLTDEMRGMKSHRSDNFWIDITNDIAICKDPEALDNFVDAVKNSVKFMDSKKG